MGSQRVRHNWATELNSISMESLGFSIRSDQIRSVAQSCPTLCDPMDCITPGLPVHHQLLEFTQTHVCWVGDAIQPSHPLSSPSPAAFNLSIRVFSNESVLYIRWPKYWSFSFSISPSNEYSGLISLGWTGWISLQSKGLSRVFSNTTVQKHQFFGTQLSLWRRKWQCTLLLLPGKSHGQRNLVGYRPWGHKESYMI